VGPGLIAAAAAGAVCIVLFGLSPAGALPFVLLAMLGLALVFAEIFGTTVIQTATPGALMGRVFGAFEDTFIGSMLLGTISTGPLIGALGPRTVTVIFALLALSMLLLCLPSLRRLETALGVRGFLRQVPALAPLSRTALDDLALHVQLEHVPAGTTIVREGEPGDKLYIVKSGEVSVLAHGSGERDVEVATLAMMDYFGEIALLRDVPRTATVRAHGPVELYSLSRADFQQILARSEELREALSGTSDARYIDTRTSCCCGSDRHHPRHGGPGTMLAEPMAHGV
jgi:hypothetical protein